MGPDVLILSIDWSVFQSLDQSVSDWRCGIRKLKEQWNEQRVERVSTEMPFLVLTLSSISYRVHAWYLKAGVHGGEQSAVGSKRPYKDPMLTKSLLSASSLGWRTVTPPRGLTYLCSCVYERDARHKIRKTVRDAMINDSLIVIINYYYFC